MINRKQNSNKNIKKKEANKNRFLSFYDEKINLNPQRLSTPVNEMEISLKAVNISNFRLEGKIDFKSSEGLLRDREEYNYSETPSISRTVRDYFFQYPCTGLISVGYW